MKYRYLGSTGLSVSELCFGAMTFGEKRGLSRRAGTQLVGIRRGA